MKKLIVILFLIVPLAVQAKERQVVTLAACIDGDTAKFTYQGKISSYRFLAINTRELKEPYGQEAKEYTCNQLTKAKTITVEYDLASTKQDKYYRELVWVFVDGELLQEKLIRESLAEIKYVYGDYQYLAKLETEEQIAKFNHKGIWTTYHQSNIVVLLNYLNKFLANLISLLEKL
jgi:micrococcal nuclease